MISQKGELENVNVNENWDKQNLLLRNLTFGLFGFMFFGAAVSLWAFVVGLMLLGILFFRMRQNPDTMFRVVDEVKYKDLESHLSALFEQNSIPFQQRTKVNAYFYEFVGYDLHMEVSEHPLAIDAPEDMYRYSAQLKVGKMNGVNRPFAEHLATLIDDMLTNNFEN